MGGSSSNRKVDLSIHPSVDMADPPGRRTECLSRLPMDEDDGGKIRGRWRRGEETRAHGVASLLTPISLLAVPVAVAQRTAAEPPRPLPGYYD